MLKKTIDVFWAAPIGMELDFFEPESCLRDLADKTNIMDPRSINDGISLKKCSAVIDYLKNTFRIRSPLKYNIQWMGGENQPAVISTMLDQQFFDNNVLIRDHKTGLLSLAFARLWLVTEEPSLTLEIKHAGYSSSNFSKDVRVVEGSFDLGKWFRPLDLAFFINYPKHLIDIERGDSLYYIKFHTHYKINLRKFHLSEEIQNLISEITKRKHLPHREREDTNKLEKYYRYFRQIKYKNHILKLVKQNILD